MEIYTLKTEKNSIIITRFILKKFQVFLNKEEYFTDKHPSLETISSFMFNKRQWLEAFKLSNKLGLKVLALPLNVSTLAFCEKHSQLIDMYEIHSVCFNEYSLLKALNKTNKINSDRCVIFTLEINISNIEVAPNIRAVDKFVSAINKQINPIQMNGINRVFIFSKSYCFLAKKLDK